MVFPYLIDTSAKHAIVAVFGVVKGRDITDTICALYEDPRWERGFNTLWDGRRITGLDSEPTDLGWFAHLQQQYAAVAGEGRDVLLVGRDEDVATAMRYESLSRGGPRPALVCRQEVEARILLGMSASD